jgi:uncharacterized caspase-like protein
LVFVFVDAKTYGVIVGVAEYESKEYNLRFSDDDAILFNRLLTSGKDNSNITLLTNKNATRQNVLDALELQFSKADESDMVVFYFSGHGNDSSFLTTDVDIWGQNVLKHKDVKEAFKKCRAKIKFCIADACFSGGIKSRSSYKGLNQSKLELIIFMSCKANETSLEYPKVQQGVFSYFLIEGLKGYADFNKDKQITIKELYTYVNIKVTKKTQKRQTPIVFGKFDENVIVGTY